MVRKEVRELGRPPKHTEEELLDSGARICLARPGWVESTLLPREVARKLGCSSSTFADKFGIPDADGIPTRRDPVRGYFYALAARLAATQPPDDAVRSLIARIREQFPPELDDELRRRLAGVRAAGTPTVLSEAQSLLTRLRRLGKSAGADACLSVLAAVRGFVPADAGPGGDGLSLEQEAVGRLAAALPDQLRQGPLGNLPGQIARLRWLGQSLAALQLDDPQLCVAVLRAEARARHGKDLQTVLAAAKDELPDRPGQRLRDRDMDAARLGAARGYTARGEQRRALEALPADTDDTLLLVTLAGLYHAAVACDDEAVRTQVIEATRNRVGQLRRFAAAAGGDYDGPDDLALEEAVALSEADPEQRVKQLSSLVAEQLTSRMWRRSATGWSLPQTVEVAVDELARAHRPGDAEVVVADLLQVAGWPHPDPQEGLTGDGLPLLDRAALDRLVERYPTAVPAPEAVKTTRHLRFGIDPDVWRTRRWRGPDEPPLPRVAAGELLAQFVLGADPTGERHGDSCAVTRRHQCLVEDQLRQVGWLLELRAARRQ